MIKNQRHWANNCAGIFLISVLFLVVTFFGNRLGPSGATGALTVFFCLLGVVSLAGWAWFAFASARGDDSNARRRLRLAHPLTPPAWRRARCRSRWRACGWWSSPTW